MIKKYTLLATLALAPIFAQAEHHEPMKDAAHAHETMKGAIAIIVATEGNPTAGHVLFTQVEGGVRVEGKISGLTPGKHGFHVHQYGDLRKSDGTSTGGHFNPTMHDHAGPDSDIRHIGDLGNVIANEAGVAEFDFLDTKLTFEGSSSIIGRGLIVHAGEDDLQSQPTGAAGARVGMAVIGHFNPEL